MSNLLLGVWRLWLRPRFDLAKYHRTTGCNHPVSPKLWPKRAGSIWESWQSRTQVYSSLAIQLSPSTEDQDGKCFVNIAALVWCIIFAKYKSKIQGYVSVLLWGRRHSLDIVNDLFSYTLSSFIAIHWYWSTIGIGEWGMLHFIFRSMHGWWLVEAKRWLHMRYSIWSVRVHGDAWQGLFVCLFLQFCRNYK